MNGNENNQLYEFECSTDSTSPEINVEKTSNSDQLSSLPQELKGNLQNSSDATIQTNSNKKIPRKKPISPWGYASMSLFIYPGIGQIARGQKLKGLIIILFFTIFFIWWVLLAIKGVINIYSIDIAMSSPTSCMSSPTSCNMEQGVAYLKSAIIPAVADIIIFIHSVWDAYRG